MTDINAFEYVFALAGCEPIEGRNDVRMQVIHGTAFYLQNDNFLVAGHCLEGALNHKTIALGYKYNHSFMASAVTRLEIISKYDIAFVKAKVPGAKALKWDYDELSMLGNIQTVGFPHALDVEQFVVRVRAFKGYIVCPFTYHKLPSNPRCYELSFRTPRGLSGSPLFTQETVPRIKGVVIANESIEVPIYTEKEVIERKDDKETVTEIIYKHEASQFGIAIQAGSMKRIVSTILGGSLEEYLRSVNLV